MRTTALLLLLFALTSSAAPKKAAAPPAPVAPAAVPHPVALFLAQLSDEGARAVTFRASAVGKLFFLEEPAGVTVYRWNGDGYVRQEFLKGTSLAKALAARR